MWTRRNRADPVLLLRLRRTLCWLVLALLTVFAAPVANAVQPDEILSDPALEARARHISGGLRCLVCQNQSIDDSNAPLARDLRLLVRERLEAGDSDTAVIDYVVKRYGDFVLLRPPLNIETIALWIAPFLLLVGAAILARRQFRGANRALQSEQAAAEPPLSDEEAQRLRDILSKNS